MKGLAEGRPYEFRVAAVNDAGVGAFAEAEAAFKPAAPACESKTLFVEVVLGQKFGCLPWGNPSIV